MTKTDIHLTEAEHEISALVNELLADEGMGITEATEHAIKALPRPRPEFVLWLSGGTLALVGTEIYRVADLDAD